jgi:RNAse (barnase) inhibitor barstar
MCEENVLDNVVRWPSPRRLLRARPYLSAHATVRNVWAMSESARSRGLERTMPTLQLEGQYVNGIAAFYEQINRVFMRGESWILGNSLDALNDVLGGQYGVLSTLRDEFPVTLVWKDHELSRAALGKDVRRDELRAKLQYPTRYDVALVQKDLDEYENGVGSSYFDLILEVFDQNASRVRLALR